MTRVHLVRHGRTASNRERRTMGWLDEGIEPGWVRAAVAVADVLGKDLNARVGGALDQLFADLVDGRVAVVFTHDAVVRAAIANCSITTVGMVAGVHRLVRMNENAHLEGLGLEP
ncbi:MAG TPA: hypothetical protein VIN56_01420 [Candidatus Dormibacteraeota bacterium]